MCFIALGCNSIDSTKSVPNTANSKIENPSVNRIQFESNDSKSLHINTDDLEFVTNGLPKSKHVNNVETVYTPYKYELTDLHGELYELWSINAGDYSLYSLIIDSFGVIQDGWQINVKGIGDYIYDPQSGTKKEGVEYIGHPSTDNEFYLYNSSGCINSDTALKNKNGDTMWSVNLSTSYGKSLCKSYVCKDYLITDYPTFYSDEQIIGVDLLNGNATWVIRPSCSVDYGLCSMNIVCIYEDRFWLITNDIDKPSVLYRIDLSGDKSVGIVAYDIEDPQYATVLDDKLLVISEDMTTVLLINPDNGYLIDQIDLKNLVPDSYSLCEYGNNHPLSFSDGTNYYYIDDIDTHSYKRIYWPVYKIQSSEIGFMDKQYHPNGYWSVDSNSVFGFDTTNGERRWYIDRTGLENNTDVLITSHNAVLIKHGNYLSAYGKK